MRATARPWLPSVAATNVTGRSVASATRRSSSVGGSGNVPYRSTRRREIAHDAPRILNDGSSKRLDSTFTQSASSPSSAASAGASTSGVTAYPGSSRWNARGLRPGCVTAEWVKEGCGTRWGFA